MHFNSLDRKILCNHSTFRPLIDELKNLEYSGIVIKHKGINVKILFSAQSIKGDNLGAHAILGFVESFTASSCCRFCSITKVYSETACEENDILLRNELKYNGTVNKLQALRKISNVTHLCSIKEKSVWNELKNFHVTKNFATDIIHDLDEGVSKVILGFF